jgi:hypothetical protein
VIWAFVAVLVGLGLGVGLVLLLVRPDSIRSAHKPVTSERAPAKAVAPTTQAKRSRRKTATVDPVVSPPEPVAASVPITPSQDTPRVADQPLDFPEAALRAAWRRQGGLCAQCGRLLIWASRNQDSGIGAWQSHHRIPRNQGGTSDLKNCVLFCSGAANCHFNTGHGGIGWHHYSPLDDSMLLYLHAGGARSVRAAAQTRTKPGLMRQVFGIRAPGQARRRSATKPGAKRPPPSLTLGDDYDEAY